MKFIIDVEDDKSPFVVELLENLSFVDIEALSEGAAKTLEGIRQAVVEVNLIKEGKLEGTPAEDLFNDL